MSEEYLKCKLFKAFTSINFENEEEFQDLHDKPFREFAAYMCSKFARHKKILTALRNFQNVKEKISSQKSDMRSEVFRIMGNQLFKKEDYKNPLGFYFEGITSANSKKSQALCYGNVSACFLKLGNFPACLVAIQEALTLYTFKDNFFEKLTRRREECKRLLEIGSEYVTSRSKQIKLSYPENPQNPEIADCLEIRFGEGVFAKQDLKSGHIIANTRLVIYGPTKKESYLCENCHINTIETGIVPCELCTNVIYCSSKCKAEDFELHLFLCNNVFVGDRLSIFQYKSLKFALKTLLKGIDITKDEMKSTLSFEASFENQIKLMNSMKMCFLRNHVKFDAFLNFFVILDHLKRTHGHRLLTIFRNFENGEELFFKTYWKGYQVAYINSKKSESPDVIETSSFDYLLGLLSHSCTPNVVFFRRLDTGQDCYLMVRDVKAGEELTFAYR